MQRMVRIGEVSKNEEIYLQNELSSLGVCCKRVNHLMTDDAAIIWVCLLLMLQSPLLLQRQRT